MAVKKSGETKIDAKISKLNSSVRKSVSYNLKKNKQIVLIIGGMIGLVLLFFVFYFIFQSTGRFKYDGLTFTKERFSNLVVYHYYYNFDYNGKIYNYNLYLRLDPRNYNFTIDKKYTTYFEPGKFTYISINTTGFEKCPDSSLAIGELSAFLANNFLNPTGATPDEQASKQNNITYATCQNKRDRVVILIQAGNETRIEVGKQSPLCSVITVSNCEILPAVERYIIETVADAKKNTALEQGVEHIDNISGVYHWANVPENSS